MNDVFLVLLSLSISGGILTLLLLALKPLIKNRFSNTWQYYIWLIVLLRFLVPVTAQVNLMGSVAQYIENRFTVTDQTSGQFFPKSETGALAGRNENLTQTPQTGAQAVASAKQDFGKAIQDNIWLIWATGMLVMFFYKVISYNGFVRYVKIGAEIVEDALILDIYRAELATARVKRKIPLKVNHRIGSPMLAGIIWPVLVIPSLELDTDNLRYVFRHELTHYRRGDILYKWFVQITKCLHWFNPLVYLIGKQIDQICELSCDETIIKPLDEPDRECYGDALIASLKSQENYSSFVILITMSDNKKRLKERLDAIIEFKKKSKLVTAFSLVAAIFLASGATAIGAYATPTVITDKIQSGNDTGTLNQYYEVFSTDNIYTMGENGTIHIPFLISSIEEGYICLGQIPNLNDATKITYDVSADTGTGLFIGMKSNIDQIGWYNYVERSKYVTWSWDSVGKDSSYTGNYYLYVGTTKKALSNILGTITIEYNTSSMASDSSSGKISSVDQWPSNKDT